MGSDVRGSSSSKSTSSSMCIYSSAPGVQTGYVGGGEDGRSKYHGGRSEEGVQEQRGADGSEAAAVGLSNAEHQRAEAPPPPLAPHPLVLARIRRRCPCDPRGGSWGWGWGRKRWGVPPLNHGESFRSLPTHEEGSRPPRGTQLQRPAHFGQRFGKYLPLTAGGRDKLATKI